MPAGLDQRTSLHVRAAGNIIATFIMQLGFRRMSGPAETATCSRRVRPAFTKQVQTLQQDTLNEGRGPDQVIVIDGLDEGDSGVVGSVQDSSQLGHHQPKLFHDRFGRVDRRIGNAMVVPPTSVVMDACGCLLLLASTSHNWQLEGNVNVGQAKARLWIILGTCCVFLLCWRGLGSPVRSQEHQLEDG